MARDLSTQYQNAARAKHRRPTCMAYAYYGADGSQVCDLTPYLLGARASFSLEHEASEANISLLNPNGIFDPLGGSAYATVLAENNKVVIKMGYSDQIYNVFTGRIPEGRINYAPDQAGEFSIPLHDMGKNLWEQRITSTLYENQQVNDILTDVLTTKAGVAAGDISLAAQSYIVERIQFVDEAAMDIGYMLMLPNRYRLYWDYDGKLVSKAPDPPGSSSWDYSGGDIVLVRYEWGDPTINKVVVTGRNLEPEQQLGGEEYFKWLVTDGGLSWFSWKVNGVRWERDTDGVIYEEVRVEKALLENHPGWESGDSHSDAWWAAVQGPFYRAWGVFFKFPPLSYDVAHGGSGSSWLKCEFIGKQATWVTPRVQGVASDSDLITKYGTILMELDNPVVQSDSDAAAIAAALLDRAKSYRYQVSLNVVQNLLHEPGDRITFVHPKSQGVIACQISRVTHSFRGGDSGECSTSLDLLKL